MKQKHTSTMMIEQWLSAIEYLQNNDKRCFKNTILKFEEQ